MTRHRSRFCFAVLLLLWQLVAGSFAHAGPTDGTDCGHDHAAHEQAAPGPEGPAHEHGSGCDSAGCTCPCGHTPALRVDLNLDSAVPPPAERPKTFVDAVLLDPIEEHFRPPN